MKNKNDIEVRILELECMLGDDKTKDQCIRDEIALLWWVLG